MNSRKFLVHGSDVIRKCEHELALAGGHRAGKRATPEDFHWCVVRKNEMVVGGAKRFCVGLQLLVAADELHGFDLRCGFCATTQQDEEIGIAHLRGFAEIDGIETIEFFFVFGNRGIDLGVAPGESREASASLRNWAQAIHR